MNIEEFRNYCLNKPGVTEGFPFGPETIVFKVSGKIFTIAGIDNFERVNLKCDPERAIELREEYTGIIPGYHMNKNHWNTVYMDGSVPPKLVRELIDLSYKLVAQSLPKVKREALGLDV